MKRIIDLSGGGATASLPTFLGCAKEESKTSHLAQPTQICLKFKRISQTEKYSPNLEIMINGRIPSFQITIDIAEDTKVFKVTISFKRPEDLEKAKSLLKTLEIPFTDKGKTSNRKPEFSVVQPKKGDQKVESDEHLEPFPLGILGDHHLAPVQPMHQSVHKFLHPSIYVRFKGFWLIDDTEWGDLVKLQYYESLKSLGGTCNCAPHPNNQESQRQIVEMQQRGVHHDSIRNWTHAGFLWVPRRILEIPEYWIPHCFAASGEEIQQPDPATFISSPDTSISSPYPLFDMHVFIASLRGEVDISDHHQDSKSYSSFWLKQSVASALFQPDSLGNPTTDLKVRYAQMIEANAYIRNQGFFGRSSDGKSFPGIKERITIPEHLLIMRPGSNNSILIQQLEGRKINGVGIGPMYRHVGKVLIPWQFLRMPGVWANFERSSIHSY